jgi:hypothetical protein
VRSDMAADTSESCQYISLLRMPVKPILTSNARNLINMALFREARPPRSLSRACCCQRGNSVFPSIFGWITVSRSDLLPYASIHSGTDRGCFEYLVAWQFCFPGVPQPGTGPVLTTLGAA